MSLFYQHIAELYSNAEYATIKEELQDFEKTAKPFPTCIYGELDYAESNEYRQIRDENIFPIRFLWLFELKEQVITGMAMPLARSLYNPELLYERWLKCVQDGAFRQEATEAGINHEGVYFFNLIRSGSFLRDHSGSLLGCHCHRNTHAANVLVWGHAISSRTARETLDRQG